MVQMASPVIFSWNFIMYFQHLQWHNSNSTHHISVWLHSWLHTWTSLSGEHWSLTWTYLGKCGHATLNSNSCSCTSLAIALSWMLAVSSLLGHHTLKSPTPTCHIPPKSQLNQPMANSWSSHPHLYCSWWVHQSAAWLVPALSGPCSGFLDGCPLTFLFPSPKDYVSLFIPIGMKGRYQALAILELWMGR